MNKFTIFYLSIFIFLGRTTTACGPESINREFSLFLKSYTAESPMYYYYYNGGSYDYGKNDRRFDNKLSPNQKEWVQLLGGQFEITKIEEHINRSEALTSASDRKLEKYLDSEKPLIKKYINQLWKYQDYTNQHYDKWNYNAYVYRKDSSSLIDLIEETKKIYRKTSNNNLKWRCAYHMVRMAHFHKYTHTADKLYSQFVEPLPTGVSVMEQWCHGLKGGILKRQGKKERAFVHFAKRFVNDPSDFSAAYVDLKRLSSVDFRKALRYCKSNAERRAVLVASSVNSPSFTMETLSFAEKNLKDEKILKFIFERELQKLEADFIRRKIMNTDQHLSNSGNLQLPQAIELRSLLDFTKKQNSIKPTSAYWQNATAYLALANDNKDLVIQSLGLAQKAKRINSVDRAQTKMLSFLNECVHAERLNKNKLADFIVDFYNDKNIDLDDRNALGIFNNNFVLPKLIEQGDMNEALAIALVRDEGLPENEYWNSLSRNDSIDLFHNSQFVRYYLNYTANEKEFKKTVDYFMNDWSPFLQKLKERFTFHYRNDDYNQFLFYKKVRKEEWAEAIALSKKTSFLNNHTFYDPFEMHYDDHRTPHKRDVSKGTWTATELMDLGLRLKNAQSKRKPQTIFRYAQFLYHLTYYGFNRAAMDDNTYEYRYYNTPIYYDYNKIETEEWFYWYYKLHSVTVKKNAMSYYNCSTAMRYFEKALSSAKTAEDKARINFMLARCYQKSAPLPEFKKDKRYGYQKEQAVAYNGKKYFGYSYHSFKNPYFKELKTRYGHTQTYREAFEGCSYLRMFLD